MTAARCRAASTRAAPIRCRSMTATASSSTWSRSFIATRPTPRGCGDMWPRVRAAADHIETLAPVDADRGQPRPAATRPLYGLLPPSISHEGYSARPAYSYWDDFWALTGLKDAAWLARQLGAREEARLLATGARPSSAATSSPRSPRRARFTASPSSPAPPTSAISTPPRRPSRLSPGRRAALLPPDVLAATFERYWQESVARRDGTRDVGRLHAL